MTGRKKKMNENGIVSYNGLNPENIDKSDFTNSLALEAVRAGIFTESDLDRIRTDLMNSLAEIIGLYTENQSSSLKADTARDLTESMMYNIDTYLLSLGDLAQALEQLRSRKTYELYGKGYLINKKHFETAKHLYGTARYSRLKNASEAYNKTLDKYFRYYLTHYDPRFFAHTKVYLTLIEYGISGSYHINEAVEVLKKLITINRGRQSDVTITAETNHGIPSGEE